MADLSIKQATASNLTDNVEDFSVDPMSTQGATDQDETTYMNSNWAQQWGYFNQIPDLKAAIIDKATWITGKGFTCDPATQVILDRISGWGKDSFDDILLNGEIVKRIGGDFFAEIIRGDDKIKTLINLKPLDTASMRIVVDRYGVLKRYEQVNKIGTKQQTVKKFKPEDIFHLSHNRLADQIHGISDIDAVEKTLLADGESFTDVMKVMHRQARPMIMFKLGTDDQPTIDAFVAKMDAACNKGENIYIPDDKNAVSYEVVQVQVSPMVLEWRNDIRKKFYRTIGLPELFPSGGGDTTESGGKIGYLSFEQVIEKDQRHLERQILKQLKLEINLIPPATLQSNLQTDNSKDASQGLGFQSNETQAGVGQ